MDSDQLLHKGQCWVHCAPQSREPLYGPPLTMVTISYFAIVIQHLLYVSRLSDQEGLVTEHVQQQAAGSTNGCSDRQVHSTTLLTRTRQQHFGPRSGDAQIGGYPGWGGLSPLHPIAGMVLYFYDPS